MQKAVIFYSSRTGTTKQFAEEIANYLGTKNLDVHVSSIDDYKEEALNDATYLLLGCWTSGLFFFLQHPDKAWKNFASRLPKMGPVKSGFFTTYKTLTGSMFRNMQKQLDGKIDGPSIELKSRNGKLADGQKKLLNSFIGEN